MSNFAWYCDRILIEPFGDPPRSVITSAFTGLIHRASGVTSTLPSVLVMHFFGELVVPLNEIINTEERAGEKILHRSFGLRKAVFNVRSFAFSIRAKKPEADFAILRVEASDGPFPPGFSMRIIETLRYVLLSPVSYGIMEIRHAGALEVTVTPKSEAKKGIFVEPLSGTRMDLASDFWRLFSDYFCHVLAQKDSSHYHPLSAQLYPVIEESSKNVYIAGLLVSVAVEGILNSEFQDFAPPKSATVDAIKYSIKLVDRMARFNPHFANRLKGALGAMNMARAKDKLYMLEQDGVITREMREAWEKLRNSATHASMSIDDSELPVLWKRCNSVYTLLNILVFLSIGYEGKYFDYSTIGWPIKEFQPPKSYTGENN